MQISEQTSSARQVPLARRIFSIGIGAVIAITSLIGLFTLTIVALARFIRQPAMRDHVRHFNKTRLNPLMLSVVGNRQTIIKHVGRRSGHEYATPIIAQPMRDGFVIALTYGHETDWYRNVQAAGHCALLIDEQEYQLEKPELLSAKEALPAFSLMQRIILSGGGIHEFLLLHKRKVAV